MAQLFDADRKLSFLGAVLIILQKHDLSIVKRLYKLLFNMNEVGSIELESNIECIRLISQAFKHLLSSVSAQGRGHEIIFGILLTLRQFSEVIFRYVVLENSLLIIKFAYVHSYIEIAPTNNVLIEQVSQFVKEIAGFNPQFLESFEDQVKGKGTEFEDFQYIEFVLKVFVLAGNVTFEEKFRFIYTFCEMLIEQFKAMIAEYSDPSMPLANSYADQKEPFLVRIEKLISLSTECTVILDDNSHRSTETETLAKLAYLRERYAEIIEKFFDATIDSTELVSLYGKLMSISTRLDMICHSLQDHPPTSLVFEDFPLWLKLNFKYLKSESELLSFQSLKNLHMLLEMDPKHPLIDSYNRFIYTTQKHFEVNELCWQIISKIVGVLDISDFRKLALSFLFKFIKFSISFISSYLISLLQEKKAEGFRQVSVLWMTTSSLTNNDCKLILQDTVHPMLAFVDIEDPIIRNHFKNWLLDSQENFSVILNTVFKELMKYTNWVIKGGKGCYNYPFDCDQFLLSLKNLRTLLVYGSTGYVNYIKTQNISDEFEFFVEELNMMAESSFRDNSKTYLMLLVRSLVRYLSGEYNESLSDSAVDTKDHLSKILRVKEQIAVFLEELFVALGDQDLMCELAFKIAPVVISKLEETIKSSTMGLQLELLMLLKILLFRSDILKDKKYSKLGVSLLELPRFLATLLFGLNNNYSFIIREYISFINQLFLFMALNFKHPHLTQMVRGLLLTYLQNIQSKCEKSQSLREEELFKDVAIELLIGMKNCLDFFLQVNEVEEKVNSGGFERTFIKIFTLGIVESKEEVRKKITFNKDPTTCSTIVNYFEVIFEKFIFCLKGVRQISDLNIFQPFDPIAIYTADRQGEEVFGIRKVIIDIMTPLVHNLLPGTIDAIVQNWMKTIEELNPYSFIVADALMKNIKLLDLILHLKISPVRFLSALQNCKQMKNIAIIRRYETMPNKDLKIIQDSANYETAFLSFLYVYLKYEKLPSEAAFDYYSILLNIFKVFESSVTPSTLIWLLDIVDLIITKIKIDMTNFSKLKLDWIAFITDLFTKCNRVCAKELTIVYRDAQGPETRPALPPNPSCLAFLSTGIERSVRRSPEESFLSNLTS